MSSRTIASFGSKRRKFSRQRAVGRATSSVIELLERRVLMTHATLAASYDFGEADLTPWGSPTVTTASALGQIAGDKYIGSASLTADTPIEHKSLSIHARILVFDVTFYDSPHTRPAATLSVSDASGGSGSVAVNNSDAYLSTHHGDYNHNTSIGGWLSDDYQFDVDLTIPHVNSVSNSNTAALTFDVTGASSWGITYVSVDYVDPKVETCNCAGNVGPQGNTGANVNQLASSAFGGGFDPTLDLTNSDQSVVGGDAGNNSVGLSSLYQSANGTIVAIDGANSSRWFDDSGGTFTARYGVSDTLTHDSGAGVYQIADTNGGVSTYYDFSNGTPALRGKLKEVLDPADTGSGTAHKTVYNYTSGQLTSIERSDGSDPVVRFKYNYLSSGSNSGKLASITLEQQTGTNVTSVRSELFDYYTGGSGVDSHGRLGDLKSVVLTAGATNAATIDTTYYRYWTAGNTNTATLGYLGGLEMVLGPASDARAVAAGHDPLASDVGDSTLDDYADNYYTYYPATHMVHTQAVQGDGCSSCSGGIGTYTYSYTASGFASTTNTWANKVEETLPDGNKNITYYNTYQQPILQIFQDTTTNKVSGTFYKYDSNNRQIWLAHPSALNLPTNLATIEAFPDLLDADASGNYFYMNDTTGKIDVTTYYDTTTAGEFGAGGVKDMVEDTKLQHGELAVEAGQAIAGADLTYSAGTVTVHLVGHGYDDLDHVLITGASHSDYNGLFTINKIDDDNFSYTISTSPASPDGGSSIRAYRTNKPILLNHTDYFQVTAGSAVTDPVADYTVYRNADGTGGETTSYSYSWYSGTVQMETMEVSRPAIAVSQNGNNAGESDTTFFDQYGRTIWTKDADSVIDYTAYDTATGAVVKTITDVNYASLDGDEQTSFDSTGWSDPSGLNLMTTIDVDALGRPTKITDPNENASAGTGNVTYINYNDPSHEIRTFPGWYSYTSGTNTLYTTLGPAQVEREDRAGSYTEELTYVPTPGTNSTPISEAISRSMIRTLSRMHISSGGQADESLRFFDLGSLTYSTGAGTLDLSGSAGTNFYETTYGYDSRGRQDKVVDPLGTISRMVYDGQGRLVSTWTGTSDAGWSPNNAASMTKLADYLYDSYDPAVSVSGDSNPTRVTTYPSGTNSARTVDSYYDWRDRLVATKFGVDLNGSSQEDYAAETNSASVQRLISYSYYDNLDEPIQVDQFDGDGDQMLSGNVPKDSNADGVPDAPDSSTRRGSTAYSYDDQGRVWQTQVFDVDQSDGDLLMSGTNTLSLKSWSWYDHRGNLIKTQDPGGLVTKSVYDGAGRVIEQYTTDGGDDDDPGAGDTWADAGDVTGDNVLEQTQFQYDANSNLIFSINKLHYYDDTNTGELGDASTTPKARVLYTAFYFDRLNRQTAQVEHGTNGGLSLSSAPASASPRSAAGGTTTTTGTTSTLIDTSRTEASGAWIGATLKFTSGALSGQVRTVTAYDQSTGTISFWGTTSSAPASGVTYTLTPNALVTTYDYNDSGWGETATDPRGFASKTYYDLAGRTAKTIADYVNGTAGDGTHADDDQITAYTYDGNDNILTMKAVVNNSGTNNVFQTTQYVYGVVAGTNATDSNLTSNDLLAKIEYPDKTSGNPSTNAANIESFSYNTAGDQKTLSDRNGNVHTYAYDDLGRLTSDNVTTLGTGVDGTVRRIDYNFDTAGRPYQMTSYSNTNASTTLNQIQYAYNGYGQMTAEYQTHSGAVSTGSSPVVQYAYNEGGDNDGPDNNNSRLKSITYPNGRIVRYEYGTSGGLNDTISRLAYLADDSNGSVGTRLEEYQYLGLSTVVTRNRPNANSSMTLSSSSGDHYPGLDRFNRVVTQSWIKNSDSSTLDGFQYGYDADSNLLYKNNTVSSSFSELYHLNGATNGLDGLNRLTDMRRGTLSDANSDGVMDTVTTLNTIVAGSQKSWDLDATGNWNSSTKDGTTTTRTNNLQNQVTAVSGATSPSYDNSGNTTTDDTNKTYTYDAWNRMVAAKSGTNTVQAFTYDAAGERATENSGTSKDLYYSSGWQVLEEHTSGIASSQNVWSPFYVDDLIERDRDADGSLDGSLDSSFDSDGKLTTDFNGNSDVARAVAIQADGKTVVAGYADHGSGDYDFAVARYNVNGSLDTSFGGTGKLTFDLGTSNDLAYAVAIEANGKILVAGQSGTNMAMICIQGDSGSLDGGFNSTGKVTTSFGTSGDQTTAYAIAIQSDGKIVLGGYTHSATDGHYEFAVARYNTNGSLDTSGFSGDGKATLYDSGTPLDDFAYSMALQPDGKIVVGGQSNGDLALGRFNTDGSADTSFDTDGIATTSIAGTQQINGLVVQPDGKIIVGGLSGTDFIIARFGTTGTLDSSFGTSSGYTTTDISGTDAAYSLAQQADGKFVAAGVSSSGNFGIVRYNIGGTLDTTFNTTGKLSVDFGSTDTAYALAIGPDYKITLAGVSGSDFAVARLKVASGLEERLYALTDVNHNVTALLDVFGAVKERFVYDPYGTTTVLTSTWATASDTYAWAYRDQGLRYDSVTNSQDNRERVYFMSLGRFAQADPTGYPDGANRYQDELSNSVARLDPAGTDTVDINVPSVTLPDGEEVGKGVRVKVTYDMDSTNGTITISKVDIGNGKGLTPILNGITFWEILHPAAPRDLRAKRPIPNYGKSIALADVQAGVNVTWGVQWNPATNRGGKVMGAVAAFRIQANLVVKGSRQVTWYDGEAGANGVKWVNPTAEQKADFNVQGAVGTANFNGNVCVMNPPAGGFKTWFDSTPPWYEPVGGKPMPGAGGGNANPAPGGGTTRPTPGGGTTRPTPGGGRTNPRR